ncbi:MAG: hypothetical protein ABL879_18325 [Devosia sp.]
MADELFLQTSALSEQDSERIAQNSGLLHTILKKQDETLTRVSALEDQVTAINTGFPAGDPESHRRYHETIIEDLAERRKLRQAIQEKTISGLVWAFLLGCGTAIWNEIVKRLAGH